MRSFFSSLLLIVALWIHLLEVQFSAELFRSVICQNNLVNKARIVELNNGSKTSKRQAGLSTYEMMVTYTAARQHDEVSGLKNEIHRGSSHESDQLVINRTYLLLTALSSKRMFNDQEYCTIERYLQSQLFSWI